MSIANLENLRPAPRSVPLLLKLQLLFGGSLSQFGWFFFGFGMIFAWVFIPSCDWRSLNYIGAHLVYEQGEVYHVASTNFSVGGSKTRRGNPVYANYYRFGEGSEQYDGVSYSTTMLYPGTKVTIEYSKDDPALSRIEGMGNAPLEIWPAFFVMIFPAVGFFFMYGGLRNGLRAIHLLKNGNPGYGRMESMVPTNTRINDRTVYKFVFQYTANNGLPYKTEVKTEHPELLQGGESKLIMINKYKPSEAILVDTLPGDIVIDNSGNPACSSIFYAIWVSVLPLIVIAGNLYGLYATIF